MSHVNIAILYTVEWLLDRVRTFVNCYSHELLTIMLDEFVNKKERNNNNNKWCISLFKKRNNKNKVSIDNGYINTGSEEITL